MGQKGLGFFISEKDLILKPLFYGGQQERKRRAGTENVPAIVAFAKAVELKQLHWKKLLANIKNGNMCLPSNFKKAAYSLKLTVRKTMFFPMY